jgi:hypothetical protein
MYIANPIYDTVFKYLMEDNKVAKKFISAIIKEEISELEFGKTEHTLETDTLTVCHLDFKAKITIPGGHKTVLIELQKAKLATDIMRFRRYVGKSYQDKENSYDEDRQKARQIYCIFFLNYHIGFSNAPVLEVDQQVRDAASGEEYNVENEFIESLHHRSWIVQVPELKSHRRNDLEKLLSVFDQGYQTSDHHILNIREEDFPESCRTIIRRLQKAYATPEIKEKMELEDDFLEELRNNERKIAEKDKIILEKEKALSEKDEIFSEKEKVISEQVQKIAELEQLLKNKTR